jgi:DNA-binding NtrC family response regulator
MMPDTPAGTLRRDILLTAADWQSRALILAELQELGYEVMAVPGVDYAVNAILKGLDDPPLLLIDVHHDPSATPEKVRGLISLLPGRPVILLAGVFDSERWQPLSEEVARYFRRPVRIGDVIAAVQDLLPHS